MIKKYLVAFFILIFSVNLLSCVPVVNTTSTTQQITTTLVPTTTCVFLRPRAEAIPADAVKILPEDDLYSPILHSGEYEKPVPLPFPVNTAGAEDSPFILPDGKTLFFFFTPDVRIPAEKQLMDGVTGIYRSEKLVDGTWGEPERVVLNDDIGLDGAEFIQDNAMWFCSARVGYQEINWFTAELINGKWQNWKYTGSQFPAGFEVGELHFTTDWQELYYHSSRPGGKGGFDMWMTRKVDGKWQEPENIEAVNSPDTEGWPYLTQDGRELWFLRMYRGTPAIYRSVKINGEWGEPELIISQFAGEPSLDNAGNIYFVHHYYKDNVMLEADIFIARKK